MNLPAVQSAQKFLRGNSGHTQPIKLVVGDGEEVAGIRGFMDAETGVTQDEVVVVAGSFDLNRDLTLRRRCLAKFANKGCVIPQVRVSKLLLSPSSEPFP